MNASFEDLLSRVRRGDAQAAEEIVREYEPEVRRFVRYRLNNARMRRLLDSVDICQSVFAKFFVYVSDGHFDVQHPRQLQQLLLTMASNKLLDHVRKQATARRGGEVFGDKQSSDELMDEAPGPEQQVVADDLVTVVRSHLSSDERSMLDLWMHGEDWETIAQHAGASPEATRKRFTRALDRVVQTLGWQEETA